MARFKDTDPSVTATEAQITRLRSANNRVDQLEQNINAFIAAVSEVTFNVDEADAQSWMANWQANLLSGKVGPDAIADAEAEAKATDPA